MGSQLRSHCSISGNVSSACSKKYPSGSQESVGPDRTVEGSDSACVIVGAGGSSSEGAGNSATGGRNGTSARGVVRGISTLGVINSCFTAEDSSNFGARHFTSSAETEEMTNVQ